MMERIASHVETIAEAVRPPENRLITNHAEGATMQREKT
jgi:hypothetical protein